MQTTAAWVVGCVWAGGGFKTCAASDWLLLCMAGHTLTLVCGCVSQWVGWWCALWWGGKRVSWAVGRGRKWVCLSVGLTASGCHARGCIGGGSLCLWTRGVGGHGGGVLGTLSEYLIRGSTQSYCCAGMRGSSLGLGIGGEQWLGEWGGVCCL